MESYLQDYHNRKIFHNITPSLTQPDMETGQEGGGRDLVVVDRYWVGAKIH